MVPRINAPGSSFKDAGLYQLHDKGALTSERVAFTHTENLQTADPQEALAWMAYTALSAETVKRARGGTGTGRRATNMVWTPSLAWDPEQKPTQEQMIETGRSWLAAFGLQEHQALMVEHKDEAYPHLHLIVNLIHPVTGKMNRKALANGRLTASKWAEAIERTDGKIYCEQRVENNRRREEGEYVKYLESELDLAAHITALYHAADNRKAFQSALKEAGYRLAQGRRLVLIDRDGKMHSLLRQIKGVKAKDVRAKLAGLALPEVKEVRQAQDAEKEKAGGREKELAQQQKPEPVIDRDWQERRWQEAIIDAAIKHEAAQPAKPRPDVRAGFAEAAARNALQDRHLTERGRLYAENQKAREQVEERLEKAYGAYERKLTGELAALEKLSQAGYLRKAWLKATKQLPRDPAGELEGMRGSLADIAWRKAGARDAVEKKISERTKAIDTRQTREKEELNSRYAPPPLPKAAPASGPAPLSPAPSPHRDRDSYLKEVFERQQKIARRSEDRPPRDREKEREGPDFEL